MSETDEGLTKKQRLIFLMLAGGVMFVAYWMVVSLALVGWPRLIYSIITLKYRGPLAWLGRVLGFGRLRPGPRGALFLLLMIILGGTYLAVVYLVRKEDRKVFTWVLWGGFAVFALLFLFIPSLQSRDVFSYTFSGRAISVYHENPFLLVPANRPLDIVYPMVGWKYNASVYGPVFNAAAAIITKVAGARIVLNIFLFKLLALASYAGTVGIVYVLARKVSPGRENMALAITAWSPLMIMHIIGAGHNDALMVFFIMLGFLLYRKNYKWLGMVAIVVAVSVKVIAVLALAPMVVLYLREREGSLFPRVGKAAVAVIGVPALLYAPFWAGPRIFETTRAMVKAYSGSSVPTLFRNISTQLLHAMGIVSERALNLSSTLIWLVFTGIFVVVTIAMLLKVRNFKSMIVAAAAISLIWFLTAPYILPWYLCMALVITAVDGWDVTTGAALAASTVFLFYRIPQLNIQMRPLRLPLRTGPTHTPAGPTSLLYIGLPFAAILLAWLLSRARVRSFLHGRIGGAGTGDSLETADSK